MNALATISFILIGALISIATAMIVVRVQWHVSVKKVSGSCDFVIDLQKALLREEARKKLETLTVAAILLGAIIFLLIIAMFLY